MAIFYPSMEEIRSDRLEPPTPGEAAMLHRLEELDDSYEVYFQPHVNMAHPDIVVVRRRYGVLIIEVKDWDLRCYRFREREGSKFGVLELARNGASKKSPFQQAADYKNDFYNLLCPELFMSRVRNKNAHAIVQTAVYFHRATKAEVDSVFRGARFLEGKHGRRNRYWARDSVGMLEEIRSGCFPERPSWLFTDELYDEVRSALTPSRERKEQDAPLSLTERQQELASSSEGRRQRIKGAAGSGKTIVLAQRAINAHKRTCRPVLILTFNITMRNYIRDRISQQAREEKWSPRYRDQYFVRSYIYRFVEDMCREHGVGGAVADEKNIEARMRRMVAALSDPVLKIKDRFRFDTILVDEVQDFEYEWLKLLDDKFLAPKGELVLFGDEKQNIYDRELDQRRLPRTPIRGGAWTQLKDSYRLTDEVTKLANDFQSEFFASKYDLDHMRGRQMRFGEMSGRQELRYYDLSGVPTQMAAMYSVVEGFRNDGSPIAPNDICILTSDFPTLREIEWRLRHGPHHIHCERIGETQEQYEDIVRRCAEDSGDPETELGRLRRCLKFAFNMNAGVMKLSTIHSFKGWEINTVVLVLEKDLINDEAVYTAITRAKNNLIVVNCGNERYRAFFERNLEKYPVPAFSGPQVGSRAEVWAAGGEGFQQAAGMMGEDDAAWASLFATEPPL